LTILKTLNLFIEVLKIHLNLKHLNNYVLMLDKLLLLYSQRRIEYLVDILIYPGEIIWKMVLRNKHTARVSYLL